MIQRKSEVNILAISLIFLLASLTEFGRCIDRQPTSWGRISKLWGDQPSVPATTGINQERTGMCQERNCGTFWGWERRRPHSGHPHSGHRQGRRYNQLRSPGDFEALLHWQAKSEEAENSKARRSIIVCSQLMEERSDSKEEETIGAYYLRKKPLPLSLDLLFFFKWWWRQLRSFFLLLSTWWWLFSDARRGRWEMALWLSTVKCL